MPLVMVVWSFYVNYRESSGLTIVVIFFFGLRAFITRENSREGSLFYSCRRAWRSFDFDFLYLKASSYTRKLLAFSFKLTSFDCYSDCAEAPRHIVHLCELLEECFCVLDYLSHLELTSVEIN